MRLRGDPFAETRGQLAFPLDEARMASARARRRGVAARPAALRLRRSLRARLALDRPPAGIEDRSAVVRIPVPLENFAVREHRAARPLRLLAVTNFNFPQKIAALGRFLDDYGDFLRANEMTLAIAGAGIAWQGFRTRFAGRAEFPGFVTNVARALCGARRLRPLLRSRRLPLRGPRSPGVRPARHRQSRLRHARASRARAHRLHRRSSRPRAIESLLLRLRDDAAFRTTHRRRRARSRRRRPTRSKRSGANSHTRSSRRRRL